MAQGFSGQLDAEGSGWPQGSQCSPGVSQCLGLRSQVALGSYRGPRISWQLDAGDSWWPWRSQIGSRGLSVQPLGSQGSPGVSQCLGLGAQESPRVLGWLQVSYSGPGILIAAGH